MRSAREVTLFHSPQTRSTGALILLEELGADYRLEVLDLKAGQQREPAYLAVNPLGKVPAIRHGEGPAAAVVTEQVAIFIYLADLYPEAGLAPRLDDPLRGPYLRWMSFYGSCFEPAIVDRAMQRDPAAYSTSPYGDFDAVIGALSAQLARGPYFLGERFTAVDVLWGQALNWILQFGLVPRSDLFVDYVARVQARPAFARAMAQDAALLAARQAAAGAPTPAAASASAEGTATAAAPNTATSAAAAAGAAAQPAAARAPKRPFLGLRTAKYRATDLARAKAWYSEVLDQAPYFDEPFYVGFDVGGFELGLDPDPAGSGEGPGGVTVYWGVDDAEAAYGRLLALGAREHAPPQDVGEGIRIGAVLDPFGNVFGFVQNPNFKVHSP